MEKVTIKVN